MLAWGAGINYMPLLLMEGPVVNCCLGSCSTLPQTIDSILRALVAAWIHPELGTFFCFFQNRKYLFL